MLNAKFCEIFDIPFFQFAQMKKYCPEDIPIIKAKYKANWEEWKALSLAVYHKLGMPFAEPHIERWCNGWQVRAHFFTYYKYEFNQNSAVILSVILNRRRLQVSLDWHCYRADRSQVKLPQYQQWWENLDREKYQDFEIWQDTESEYADFKKLKEVPDLTLENPEAYWCIGKNIEREALDKIDVEDFILQTIQELLPLYEACHR
nr:HI_0552 family protein [uncultured Haemophilus sp.]